MLYDACLQIICLNYEILVTIVVMCDHRVYAFVFILIYEKMHPNLSELLPFSFEFKYSYYTSVYFPDNKNLLCLPIFVLFSFKIINFAKLQFAISSILLMYMQFFYLISMIFYFHMHRYFAKQKSCILKLLYINTVYNVSSNYIFRLLIR